ncbi:TPA: hypothetical protein HA278_00225 [Candidatus Woesearchaeota archaeon]|nr:hypothetical protein [archaeon]HIJ10454.1 hypothetical protein [Candidatus Woesearchaeota archaeon]
MEYANDDIMARLLGERKELYGSLGHKEYTKRRKNGTLPLRIHLCSTILQTRLPMRVLKQYDVPNDDPVYS